MLDYKLVEALASVVQQSGFDKAARHLHLTQSAVSQRIKQLEEQTGQILVARSNPPNATPAGQRMIKHYLQVKRLEDDLSDVMLQSDDKEQTTLAIGTNRDSLTTWLQKAVQGFLTERRVVLDMRAADQEQTHKLMKAGEVMGCISVKDRPMQGCRLEYLGRMEYWLVATRSFAHRWFPNGITRETVRQAPLIYYDRKDEMPTQFFTTIMKQPPNQFPIHYVPSTKTYADFIISGLAYGLLPDQECCRHLETGELIHLAPKKPFQIRLFWHCWTLKSKLLEDFTQQLVLNARQLLPQ